MATKYRVYNELSEDEKAQIATEKQWRKRGYCPVENEGELMLDGGMFSDLELYKKRKFFQQHKYVRFDTLDELGLYEVMAVVITTAYQSDSFQYYNYIENNELTFNTYVQECKQRALYDTGMDAEYGDKLVTLSTCEYSNDNGRLIVVAKKIGGIKK